MEVELDEVPGLRDALYRLEISLGEMRQLVVKALSHLTVADVDLVYASVKDIIDRILSTRLGITKEDEAASKRMRVLETKIHILDIPVGTKSYSAFRHAQHDAKLQYAELLQ